VTKLFDLVVERARRRADVLTASFFIRPLRDACGGVLRDELGA
jgi:hypothetical protein